MVSEPGAQFGYSDSGAHLVAAVLAEAIDRPILDYAREKLFDPVEVDTRPAWQGWDTGSAGNGFDRPGFAWATDRSGLNLGSFGLRLTAADMIKLGELYVNDGQLERPPDRVPGLGTRVDQAPGNQGPAAGCAVRLLLVARRNQPASPFRSRRRVRSDDPLLPRLDLVVVVTSAVDREGTRDLYDTYFPIVEQVIVNPLTS